METKYKLIPLDSGEFIIISNGKINEGDCVFDKLENKFSPIVKILGNTNYVVEGIKVGQFLKIIASTRLDLEVYIISNTKDQIIAMYEEREAELQALEKYPMLDEQTDPDGFILNLFKAGGYKQALLDNKEKKYTEEQMLDVITLASALVEQNGFKEYKYSTEEILKLIKPKLPEVFVELEMEEKRVLTSTGLKFNDIRIDIVPKLTKQVTIIKLL